MQCINQNSDGSYEGRDCNGKELTRLFFCFSVFSVKGGGGGGVIIENLY